MLWRLLLLTHLFHSHGAAGAGEAAATSSIMVVEERNKHVCVFVCREDFGNKGPDLCVREIRGEESIVEHVSEVGILIVNHSRCPKCNSIKKY